MTDRVVKARRELTDAVVDWFEQRRRLHGTPPGSSGFERRQYRAEARILEAEWDRVEARWEALDDETAAAELSASLPWDRGERDEGGSA